MNYYPRFVFINFWTDEKKVLYAKSKEWAWVEFIGFMDGNCYDWSVEE